MPYIARKPILAPSREVLQQEITGWGVDLDPKDRPAVPKEKFNPEGTGAHWQFPDRQIPLYKREMSIEHKMLPPVFGTVCPPRGVSGAIRRYAYRRFSEGRSAHWLLLMLADRVDVLENGVRDLLRGRPDNVIAEMGLKAEITRHGFRSRYGRNRADVKHLPVDILFAAGTGLLAVGAVYALGRGLAGLAGPARRLSARARPMLEQRLTGREPGLQPESRARFEEERELAFGASPVAPSF